MKFQMPFPCGQTWRASTYNGHAPNQNSIDLVKVGGASLNESVFASAAGKVTRSEKGINAKGKYYGDVIDIDHGGG